MTAEEHKAVAMLGRWDLEKSHEENRRIISFDRLYHKYTDEHNVEYTSTTTLIGKYSPKFDTAYWAAVIANKEGTTPDKVIDRWNNITNRANEKGTAQHDEIENSINEKADNTGIKVHDLQRNPGIPTTLEEFKDSGLKDSLPLIYETICKLLKHGFRLHAEKRVYSAYYKVAGMIDCLLVNDKGEFIILDWKTNKHKMMFDAGYFAKDPFYDNARVGKWVEKKEFMHRPISHLPHCNGIKYTLQVSLYAYLCEQWGLECKKLAIYHIRDGYPTQTISGLHYLPNQYSLDTQKVKVVEPYGVPYLKNEVRMLLEDNLLRQ